MTGWHSPGKTPRKQIVLVTRVAPATRTLPGKKSGAHAGQYGMSAPAVLSTLRLTMQYRSWDPSHRLGQWHMCHTAKHTGHMGSNDNARLPPAWPLVSGVEHPWPMCVARLSSKSV